MAATQSHVPVDPTDEEQGAIQLLMTALVNKECLTPTWDYVFRVISHMKREYTLQSKPEPENFDKLSIVTTYRTLTAQERAKPFDKPILLNNNVTDFLGLILDLWRDSPDVAAHYVHTLLMAGATPKINDMALRLAALNRNTRACNLLIAAGANIDRIREHPEEWIYSSRVIDFLESIEDEHQAAQPRTSSFPTP